MSSTLPTVQLLQVLKTQLLRFFDELIALLPEEKDLLVMRFMIKDQIPITEIMQYILEKIVPLEPQILAKNETFFLEHRVLFEDLKSHHSKVNHFKEIWQHSTDPEDKQALWNWFHCFVHIGKKYQTLRKTE